MKAVRLGAVIALLTAGTQGAPANDSTAALGAGGLVLTESADISMAREDLYISRKIIRVRYSFINQSDKPITTRVAFPLPEVDLAMLEDSDTGWPTDDPDNMVGFKVTVDGRAVRPDLEARAVLNGTEVTDVLRRLGVPFDYRSPQLSEAIKKLPEAARKELDDRNLVEFQEYESGGGVKQSFALARWTLKHTFHWQQTFPAGKPVSVEHEYKPVVGASFISSHSVLKTPAVFRNGEFKEYCLDDGTYNGLATRMRALEKSRGDGAALLVYRVEYVLTTGRNWKGPIGRFRLTLDKGKPDNLISLCIDGVRKTGPTTFVVERKDFEPDKDLLMAIIEGEPK